MELAYKAETAWENLNDNELAEMETLSQGYIFVFLFSHVLYQRWCKCYELMLQGQETSPSLLVP